MDTIKNRQETFAWQKHYDALAPKVGDAAPDFNMLFSSSWNRIVTHERIHPE